MKRMLLISIIAGLILSLILPVSLHAESNKIELNEEIIYNVFVDRFNNGDSKRHEQVDIDDELAYHGGDIKGVEDRLDVIQNLGFTTVLLSPIMDNAKKGYHGYWIEDFYSIEEQFGDPEALESLIQAAHKRDMKVVLELVTNYSAESFLEKESKATNEWFKDSNIEPIDANEWMDDSLTFDQTNPEVKEYLLDVASYWMDNFDIDGYKLHAADQSDPEFIDALTNEIKNKNDDFYILAGLLQADEDQTIDYLIDNKKIDAIENPPLYETLNEVFQEVAQSTEQIYDTWAENEDINNLIYIDNINTARFSNNAADNGRNRVTAWSLALAAMYTMPGVPVIYQGSETPMYGPGYPENRYMVDFTSGNQDLEKVFEKLGTIRENFPALVHGTYSLISTENNLTLYKRELKDEILYVAINNDDESQVVELDELSEEYQLNGLIQDHIVRANDDGVFSIGLPRETAEVFVVEENQGFNWFFIGFVSFVFIFFVYFVIRLTKLQNKREKEEK